MSKKKKVLDPIKIPARLSFLSYLGDAQGCGTIRIMYPYLLMQHLQIPKVVIQTTHTASYINDPNYYSGVSFVQFQRSASKTHMDIFISFKQNIQTKYNIPMIYEIDDLLVGIPEWNYAHNFYKDNEKYVKGMIEIADCVMVSTPYLEKVYGEFNKNIHIIPNHLPKFIWGDIYNAHEYKDEKEKIKILWAGSQNHFALPGVTKVTEGGDFGNELMNFIRKTTDKYEWHIKGAIPPELIDIKDRIHFHKWSNIFNYPKAIKDIEPDICIAPLQNIHFNRSKSNIKQLEYAALGCPSVFSNVEPYKNSSLKANTDEEMISHIEALADDIDFRAKICKKDYQKVRSQIFWEESNNVMKYLNTYLNAFGKKLPDKKATLKKMRKKKKRN